MKKIILSHLIYFATNWLIAQCEDSFTNYEELPNNLTILSGGNCLSDNDIDVLDRIINLNDLNYNSRLNLELKHG